MTREELIELLVESALMEDENFLSTQAKRTKARKRLATTKKSWGEPVKPINRSYFKKKKPTKVRSSHPVRWTKPVTEGVSLKDVRARLDSHTAYTELMRKNGGFDRPSKMSRVIRKPKFRSAKALLAGKKIAS